MNSMIVAGVVFAAAAAGTVFGVLLRRVIPDAHLQKESKEVVLLGSGLVATMAALVLGLLVGAAKSSFDEQENSYRQLAMNIVLLDRTLAHFGPEASPAREELKTATKTLIDRIWPDGEKATGHIDDERITQAGRGMYEAVRHLSPKDELQRNLQTQALQMTVELARDRLRLSQGESSSLPLPFLIVLVFWFLVLFTSFGLFAPVNPTTIVMLFISALSVAGAVFLIVDLDQPLDGVLRISNVPLRDALDELGR